MLSKIQIPGQRDTSVRSTVAQRAAASMLVVLCFELRNRAHISHLQETGVGSYARHKALNDYYERIVDYADSFAEAFQGRYGILSYPMSQELLEPNIGIVCSINAFRSWVDANRASCGSEPELQNLIDNIQALNNSTLYKLQNLE